MLRNRRTGTRTTGETDPFINVTERDYVLAPVFSSPRPADAPIRILATRDDPPY